MDGEQPIVRTWFIRVDLGKPGNDQSTRINRRDFAQKQFELAAEFGKLMLERPEIAEGLPEGAFVYFEIAGQSEFNRYSRELAEQQMRGKCTHRIGASQKTGTATRLAAH